VPVAAVLVAFVVLRGSFDRIEHVLLSTAFVMYVAAAFLARPDWTETARGLVVPSLPLTRNALIVVTGTVGTTLAPWGLAFIQSYAADKHLTRSDVLFVTQVLNAVLLLPLLFAMRSLGRRRGLMGPLVNGRRGDVLALAALTIVALSIAGLAIAGFVG